jgi:hypothetical protein
MQTQKERNNQFLIGHSNCILQTVTVLSTEVPAVVTIQIKSKRDLMYSLRGRLTRKRRYILLYSDV